MNFQTMSKQRKGMLIISAVGIIAVFLPWVTISVMGLSQSTNGFRGVGILVFLAFIVSGILSLAGDQARSLDRTMWTGALIAGAIALVFTGISLINNSGGAGDFGFADKGFGIGIWIALAASLGVLADAWLFRNPGDSIKSGFESMKHNLSSNLSGPGASHTGTTSSTGPTSQVGSNSAGSNLSATSTSPSGNSSSPSASSSKIADLERLIELRNQGKITEEEYQSLKSKL